MRDPSKIKLFSMRGRWGRWGKGRISFVLPPCPPFRVRKACVAENVCIRIFFLIGAWIDLLEKGREGGGNKER